MATRLDTTGMTISELNLLVTQLQTALSTRTVIEQAKGYIAASRGISLDDAFDRLRTYARSHNRLLRDTSLDVIQHRVLV